jgi:F-type H+-transporting ATPase subunit alpha
VYAGTQGFLDEVPVDRVREFEKGLLDEFRLRHKDLLDDIASKKELNDDIVTRLKRAIGDFAGSFRK